MRLTPAELAYVGLQGLYVTEKCDGCGKLLNQNFRYTIAGKPGAYYSAVCRDLVFFGDSRKARKHSTPGKCAHCGAILEGKRRGALYCDEVRKKRAARTGRAQSTPEPQATGTASQLNQQIAYAKSLGQGDRTSGGPQPFRNARGAVAGKLGFPVEVEQRVSGSTRGARPELSRLSIPPTRECTALDRK